MTSNALLVIALSLMAALAFALASYLKHRSAEAIPVGRGGPSDVTHLARSSLRDPAWIAGIAVDTVGVALQVVALHFGAISVVQPVLVTSVVFALLLRHRLYRAVPRRDFAWAGVATLALSAFLLIAGTVRHDRSMAPDRIPAVIALVIGAALESRSASSMRAMRRCSRPSP
jgi:hypothetical protein